MNKRDDGWGELTPRQIPQNNDTLPDNADYDTRLSADGATERPGRDATGHKQVKAIHPPSCPPWQE